MCLWVICECNLSIHVCLWSVYGTKLELAGLLNGLLKSPMNAAINQVLTAALGDQLEVLFVLDHVESLLGKDDIITVGEIVLG